MSIIDTLISNNRALSVVGTLYAKYGQLQYGWWLDIAIVATYIPPSDIVPDQVLNKLWWLLGVAGTNSN